MKHVILASTSPRRRDLLESLNLKFEVVPSEYEEDNGLGLPPGKLVEHLAEGKARAVAAKYPEAVVIGADTLGVIDGKVLGKPRDTEEHREMLELLSGSNHEMVTGMAIIGDGRTISEHTTSKIWWREVSAEEIQAYIAGGEGRDLAGGYSIRGLSSVFVERIEGDFNAILGLSTYRLAIRLREFGIQILG